MQLRAYLLIIISVLYTSCTATTEHAVISKFPDSLEIEEFSYFHTDYFRCTFAEVVISQQSVIDQILFDQTREAMNTLQREDAEEPFTRYEFPEGGFAYFHGRSVADVAGDFELAGDRTLGYNIGEEIFSAKSCWRSLSDEGNFDQRMRYADIIRNSDVIVIIGEEHRHTTIVYLPEHQRAYYFGP